MYKGSGTVGPGASMDETMPPTCARWNRSSRSILSNTPNIPRVKALRELSWRALRVFNATPFMIEWRPIGISVHPAALL
jgi:hypothetical protein